MYFDLEKSLKKKRLVYTFGFWDRFFTLSIPIFLLFCLWILGYGVVQEAWKNQEPRKIGIAVLYVFVVLTPVIAYFFQSKLHKLKGKSRTNNVKLARAFAEEYGYKIHRETNEFCLIAIKPWIFKHQHERWLTIIYDQDVVYYNCTTFENVNTYQNIRISDFRNPLLWFRNKRYEKRFKKFVESKL